MTGDDAYVGDLLTVLAHARHELDKGNYPPAPPRTPWVDHRRFVHRKLNTRDAADIHRRWKAGARATDLATDAGVSLATIHRTIRNQEAHQ